ncbi:MAG: hypothetical protein ACYC9P_00775 [Rudaea sp.]
MATEREISEFSHCRLHGTSGKYSAIGEAAKFEDGMVCWKLDPAYAEWFWPLMTRVVELVLLVPKNLLEPLSSADSLSPPQPPSEKAKRLILKIPERPADCVRVYTLRVPGKAALVHKAFPTRLANLLIVRRYRRRFQDAQSDATLGDDAT